MPMFAHFGPEMVDRPWWGTVGWLTPLLMLLIVAGVSVWAVTRLMGDRRPIAAGIAQPLAPPPSDAALERARIRYASGEMARDEFVRLSRDLGAPLDREDASDG